MADKYDKNGYNSSDFKRNSNQDLGDDMEQDGENEHKQDDKTGEYMRDLLGEKNKLTSGKFPISLRLIDSEVTRVQATGKIPPRDQKYLDVYREKPVKVTVKVLLPVKEHPKFNFVGKLLGPKGNTMKHLQEETMCKMAVLGRGSMRDRQKEEELRTSGDPKYSHLIDELHVEISALAPPAEAHARIAYALAEVKKYLIPDTNEPGRQTQMREIMERDMEDHRHPLLMNPAQNKGHPYNACMVNKNSLSFNLDTGSVHPGRPAGPPGRPPPPPRMAPAHQPPPMGRGVPPQKKVISILDRARSAMESNYGYDDPYGAPAEPPQRAPRGGAPEPDFYYERGHDRYYEDDGYGYKDERDYNKGASARDGYVSQVGTRRPGGGGPGPARGHYARASPYARPPK